MYVDNIFSLAKLSIIFETAKEEKKKVLDTYPAFHLNCQIFFYSNFCAVVMEKNIEKRLLVSNKMCNFVNEDNKIILVMSKAMNAYTLCGRECSDSSWVLPKERRQTMKLYHGSIVDIQNIDL